MSDPPSKRKKTLIPPSLPHQFATPTKPSRPSETRSQSVMFEGRREKKAQDSSIRPTLAGPVQSSSTAPNNQLQEATPTSSTSKRKYIEIGSSSDSESEGSSSDSSSSSDEDEDEDEDEGEKRRKRSKRAKGPKLPVHGAVLDQDTLELVKPRPRLAKPNKAPHPGAALGSSHNAKTPGIKSEPEDIKVKLEDLEVKPQPDDESILKELTVDARGVMVKRHVLVTFLQLCGIRRAQDSAQIQPIFNAKNEPVWFDHDNKLRPNFGIDFEPNYKGWGSDFEARVKNQSTMSDNERKYLRMIPVSEFRNTLKTVTFSNMKGVWNNVQTGDGKKVAKKALTSHQWGRQNDKSKRRKGAFNLSNLPSAAYEIFLEREYQSEEYPDPEDKSRLVIVEPQYRSDIAQRFFNSLDAAHHANKSRSGKTKFTKIEYFRADNLPIPRRANPLHKAPAWFLKPEWTSGNEALAKKARPYLDNNATTVPEIDTLNKFCERYVGDARTYTTKAPPALLSALNLKAIPPPNRPAQDPGPSSDIPAAPAPIVSTDPEVPAPADTTASIAPAIPAPASSHEAMELGNTPTSAALAAVTTDSDPAAPALSDNTERQHATTNAALETVGDQNKSKAIPGASDIPNAPEPPLPDITSPSLPHKPESVPPEPESLGVAPTVRTRRPTQKALAAAENVSESEDTATVGRKRRVTKGKSRLTPKQAMSRKGRKKSKPVVEDEDEGESGMQELAGSSMHSLRLSVAKGPDGALHVRK